MIEWFESLSVLQKVYAYIAIPSSVILMLQTFLLFFGIGDGGGDIDMDSSIEIDSTDATGDGLALFSIRGIVAMLCIGGWSGIVLLNTALPVPLSIIISIIIGICSLVGMAYLMKAVTKLQDSGNIVIENAIDKVGQVYLPIPPSMSGSGKINITVQDKFTEFSAVTTDPEEIKTGETVKVVSIDDSGLLTVERVRKDENKNQ